MKFELSAILRYEKKFCLLARRYKSVLTYPHCVFNNKLKAEEPDTGKLGKLCSERKACGQKWLATLRLSDRGECALHI